MPTTEMPECQLCRFWDRLDEIKGECRRHAPRAALAGSMPHDDNHRFYETPIWPSTHGTDWCGEFMKEGKR
jgi:hypothetical protein